MGGEEEEEGGEEEGGRGRGGREGKRRERWRKEGRRKGGRDNDYWNGKNYLQNQNNLWIFTKHCVNTFAPEMTVDQPLLPLLPLPSVFSR